MGKIETIKKANIAAAMSVYYKTVHFHSEAEIFLYSRDLLTNEIKETLLNFEKSESETKILRDQLLSGEDIEEFKLADLYITTWGDGTLRVSGGGGLSTEVDKVLFTTLLTEYVKMIENEKSGTVTVTTNEDVIVKTSGS